MFFLFFFFFVVREGGGAKDKKVSPLFFAEKPKKRVVDVKLLEQAASEPRSRISGIVQVVGRLVAESLLGKSEWTWDEVEDLIRGINRQEARNYLLGQREEIHPTNQHIYDLLFKSHPELALAAMIATGHPFSGEVHEEQ